MSNSEQLILQDIDREAREAESKYAISKSGSLASLNRNREESQKDIHFSTDEFLKNFLVALSSSQRKEISSNYPEDLKSMEKSIKTLLDILEEKTLTEKETELIMAYSFQEFINKRFNNLLNKTLDFRNPSRWTLEYFKKYT